MVNQVAYIVWRRPKITDRYSWEDVGFDDTEIRTVGWVVDIDDYTITVARDSTNRDSVENLL